MRYWFKIHFFDSSGHGYYDIIPVEVTQSHVIGTLNGMVFKWSAQFYLKLCKKTEIEAYESY